LDKTTKDGVNQDKKEIGDIIALSPDSFMSPHTPKTFAGESSSAPKTRDLPEECSLLRIFLGEGDEYLRRPLYRAIVLRARELHLAGATVLRGPMGFGRSSRLHNANILRLSLDLPVVVEIVDETEKITAFLPELQMMMRGGLITMERAQVFRYRH
jgi:PII-like signaling protein